MIDTAARGVKGRSSGKLIQLEDGARYFQERNFNSALWRWLAKPLLALKAQRFIEGKRTR